LPSTGLELRSIITGAGELELALVNAPLPTPKADEVVVRIEAAPINPSDLGLLLGPADLSTAVASVRDGLPLVKAQIPQGLMKAVANRLDQSMPVGNEGAAVVVAAGDSREAQALKGKTVAVIGGAMYSQYRCVRAKDCLVLPTDATPADGASAFVNLLTSPSMVETMCMEGHKALVHTAAASNLGQMLNRICLKDGVGLVNVVRDAKQEELLRGLGARHVCNSSAPSFVDHLNRAIAETEATLAFDAIGGGALASQILTAMEIAAARAMPTYSRYGSSVHKQVYIYGGLDTRPTELRRSWHGLGRRRLAIVPVPAAARGGKGGQAARPRRRGTEDHVRQPLLARRLPAGSATNSKPPSLQPARHGREVPDRATQNGVSF
jgi:NADPH:quinone reductase-like Zn-dependent oxidoreductase